MKPLSVKVGDLVKSPYGLVTVMSFLAPKSIACVIVAPRNWKVGTPAHKQYGQGKWVYLRGFDFDASEVVCETR